MRDLWDAEAARFDDEPDHGLREPATRAAWLRLLTAHLPPAPAHVADLGSGTGTLSVLLADAGHRVDGVDFSPAMVERARAKAGARDDVTFTVADAAVPPLRAGGYDVVLCRHVLWTLPDPGAALDRWAELLAPDGLLLLVEGFWHTGSGLAATDTVALLRRTGRTTELHLLEDPVLWGGETGDERYLVVSRTSVAGRKLLNVWRAQSACRARRRSDAIPGRLASFGNAARCVLWVREAPKNF